MNDVYLYVGIGIATVIFGIFLFILLGSHNVSQPNNIVNPPDPNQKIYPLTITGLDIYPHVFHVGDYFIMKASIINPNSDVDIPKSDVVVTTTFVPNIVFNTYTGGSCISENVPPPPLEYDNSTIPIPYEYECDYQAFVGNSTGQTNATVNIQFNIGGASYSTVASKMITILPDFPEENGTITLSGTNFLVNYIITHGKILSISGHLEGKSVVIDTSTTSTTYTVGMWTIQLPKTLFPNLKISGYDVDHSSFRYYQPSSNRTLSFYLSGGNATSEIHIIFE